MSVATPVLVGVGEGDGVGDGLVLSSLLPPHADSSARLPATAVEPAASLMKRRRSARRWLARSRAAKTESLIMTACP